ncbi:NADH dehydrogenase [ubiquinone] 1 alpha subcomplex subunit 4-like 2 isoform X2 [Passer montanus]|uniref:NADH dehydrogenase [ubiquinone] 1 alpha subcomplex subunit 4-like 2 isoform X2 n=1 Tax=Passer montanus TaxID=9160 RepID=UPI00195F6462|nr:NADH dehydrogenase [ubiquinone] 1 alpha subcomplex subunit 4-like 2 isoform X2 [Passer montanus]
MMNDGGNVGPEVPRRAGHCTAQMSGTPWGHLWGTPGAPLGVTPHPQSTGGSAQGWHQVLACPPPRLMVNDGGMWVQMCPGELALYSPDVSWDRKNNPEPWNKLSPTDQYKFLAVSTDYKNLKKERPSF